MITLHHQYQSKQQQQNEIYNSDESIWVRKPDLVSLNQEKNFCQAFNLAFAADHRMKLKKAICPENIIALVQNWKNIGNELYLSLFVYFEKRACKNGRIECLEEWKLLKWLYY